MPSSGSSMSRRQALKLLATMAAGAFAASLVAACGGAAPTPPPAASSSAPSSATSSAAATKAATSAASSSAASGVPAGTRGGKVIIAQEVDPVSLDVGKTSNFSSSQAFEHIYDSLTVFDENMKVQPSLAEKWETSDATTHVFHLRKGVKWHNGREFVAPDVAYWHQRLMDPKTAAPFKGVFGVIKQIDAVDDHTVKMTLSKPYASLPAAFASLRGSAFPNKETVEKYGDLATQAVGTGPFKLAEYVAGDYVRYVRNPDYWVKDLPYIDEITLKLMVEEDQRIAALRSGQVHIGFLTAVGKQRLASEKSLTIMESPKAWVAVILINSMKKPFDDVRVRKAISMAIDRKAFIEKSVQGAGTLSGPVPTGHGDWWVPEDKLPYRQDVEGAKKLLAEAGYPNGFKAVIKTTSTQYPEFGANAVELKNQLKAINIDLTVEQMEWGALTKVIDTGGDPAKPHDYDLSCTAITFFPDPDSYVGYFTPDRNVLVRGSNTAVKDSRISEILDKAEATQDHEERKKLYLEAQLRQLTEIVPTLWLYAGGQIDGVSNKLKNYKQSFSGRRYLIKYASVGS